MASELNTGAILWRGASELDGAPIVLIATGLNGSRNAKTGAGMVQTYIMRADMLPLDALRAGADESVCGDCPHREGSCYVNVGNGPTIAYKMFAAGRYRHHDVETGAELLRGRRVRIGSYGDPAAVPFVVWQAILAYSGMVTGYTHQWRRFPEFAAYCMASCDSPSDRAAARILGFRTFRIRLANEPLETREIACPASQEAGFKTTCDRCVACGGRSAKARADVAILAHGLAWKVKAFATMRAASDATAAA
jgi:hypothetical protein